MITDTNLFLSILFYYSFYFLVYIYNNVLDVLLLQYDTKKVQNIWHFQLFLLLLHRVTNYSIGIKIKEDE